MKPVPVQVFRFWEECTMSNAVSLRPPKYRHHKAKGLAAVTINGRDIYLGKYGSAASEEAYRRLPAEHLLGAPLPS
jgi:hypothetical protein